MSARTAAAGLRELLRVCYDHELENLRNRLIQPEAYGDDFPRIGKVGAATAISYIDTEGARRGVKLTIRKVIS